MEEHGEQGLANNLPGRQAAPVHHLAQLLKRREWISTLFEFVLPLGITLAMVALYCEARGRGSAARSFREYRA